MVKSVVKYDPSFDRWFAWERGIFGTAKVITGELGSGSTPAEAHASLLAAVERKKEMKRRRVSPVYFDTAGNRIKRWWRS